MKPSNILQYREAMLADIPQIQEVRHAVKENVLSDPALVTDADCAEFLTIRGKGWVCTVGGAVIGFAIADLKEKNIWALFIRPEWEGHGIGRKLHDLTLQWYFSHTQERVWLSTAPGTRAEKFYRKAGWLETGTYGKGEVLFEMRYDQWLTKQEQAATKNQPSS